MKIAPWTIKYVGIPYNEYDCYTLTRKIIKEQLKIDLPIDPLENRCLWREVQKPYKYFDVLMFRVRSFPVHIGIYVGDGKMLHSLPKVNAVIEDFKKQYWKDRIHSVYRLRRIGKENE